MAGANAPKPRLFTVSFHERDDLNRWAAEAGWDVHPALPDQPLDGFADVGAAVVLVDGRDDADWALSVLASLSDAARQSGAALVIVTADEARVADAAYEAGATHFIPAPDAVRLACILRYALRHAERLAERQSSGRRWDDMDAARRTHGLESIQRWAGERLGRGVSVAAVRVALTRFDLVNRAHGRGRGDLILNEAAARIGVVAETLYGPDATIARTGGTEFAMVGDARRADATRAAAEVARALAAPFGEAAVGSRVGLATSEPTEDATALLARAGEAMDLAGEGGRVLQAAESAGAAPVDVLAVDLHHALSRDEVDVLFQPQADTATGTIVGVEALARWDHPRLGMLGADALFAAAERAGLGAALSDHLQRLILRRAASWPARLGGLRLSLNLTAADLGCPDFGDRFLGRVQESGFAVERLTAEITETGLIANLDVAAGLLAALRAAGCRIAIDDFGTGYSSLAYLQALPIDYLKLDKSLVQRGGDRTVAAGVAGMARSMAIATVAEGVETVEQLALIRSEGFDFYQGYLCAGALDEPALMRLMEGGSCYVS